MSANSDGQPVQGHSRYLHWGARTLLENASTLVAATHHGIERVTRAPDGSLTVDLASPHFHMLVAAGAAVERRLLSDGRGWSQAQTQLVVGSALVLLRCERIDPHPPAYA